MLSNKVAVLSTTIFAIELKLREEKLAKKQKFNSFGPQFLPETKISEVVF